MEKKAEVSTKRLRSVCHSIAHHASSNMAYLNPHLSEATRRAKEKVASIDLQSKILSPQRIEKNKELSLAIDNLRSRFEGILASEGQGFEHLNRAILFFEFEKGFPDEYCSDCHAYFETSNGERLWASVNYLGQIISLPGYIEAMGPPTKS